MNTRKLSSLSRHDKKSRGVINPHFVRLTTFGIIVGALGVSIFMTILAIWDFTGTETLWRTIATSLVIAAGMAISQIVNHEFGSHTEPPSRQ